MLLKYLIGAVLAAGPIAPAGAEESDGWFPVEQKEETPFEGDEIDPSIWVVFAKQLAGEKIVLRFPEDPTYSHPAPGVLEIASSKDGEQFFLRAVERDGGGDPFSQRAAEIQALPDAEAFEIDQAESSLLYKKEGKWVREQIVQSAGHYFLFQTASPMSDGVSHRIFFTSFQVE